MSIQVIYQSLPIAKEPRFRLQDGGLFIELDSPMPVATALQVTAGEHSLSGKVRRVREGAGAGMLVVPTEKAKLPRWLLGLGAEVGAGVEFEPEPPPPPVVVEATPVEPVAPVVEAKAAESASAVENKSAEPAAEAVPSKQTPTENATGEDEDEDGKSSAKAGDKKPASKAKKKPRRR